MRRLVCGLATVAVVVSQSLAVSAGADLAHRMTFTGTRTSTGLWQVKRTLTLSNPSWFLQPPSDLDHRSGRYAGLLIARNGVVVVGLLDDTNLGLLSFGPTDPTLKPGTYRVTLLADRPASFTLSFGGLTRTGNLRLTHSSTASYTAAPIPLEPGVPAGYTAEPVSTSNLSAIVVGIGVATMSSQADALHVCLAPQSLPCQLQPNSQMAQSSNVTVGVAGPGSDVAWRSYVGSDIPQQAVYAVADAVAAAVEQSATLVVARFE